MSDVATWSIEEEADGRRLVAVHGDFDLAAERPFGGEIEKLLTHGASTVELDLSSVGFLDSSGVRVLVNLRNRYGSQVLLGELSEPVRYLLITAGVLDWLSTSTGEPSKQQHDGSTQ